MRDSLFDYLSKLILSYDFFLSQVLFDCLKKMDGAASFRAYSLFCLAQMLRNKDIGEHMQDVNETLKLVSKVCQISETHFVYVGNADSATSYDYDLILVCLQRLLNCTVSVVLDLDPTSTVMKKFIYLWEAIRLSSSTPYLEKESLDFIVNISLFPPGVIAIDRTGVATYLKQVIEHRGQNSYAALHAAVEGCRALMLQETSCASRVCMPSVFSNRAIICISIRCVFRYQNIICCCTCG